MGSAIHCTSKGSSILPHLLFQMRFKLRWMCVIILEYSIVKISHQVCPTSFREMTHEADGKKMTHKADLKLKRSTLCHDLGVTSMYNVILDTPLTIDVTRLIRGGPLIKYEKGSYARIGVMPHYGDVDSVKWFEVEPYCTFHIINCYEGEFVIAFRGRVHITEVSDDDHSLENPFGQVVDCEASSTCALPKYGSLAKFYLEEQAHWISEIHVSVGVSGYEAINLYKGKRVIASNGDDGTNWKIIQLVMYQLVGILARIVGGLLGLGGGFILGPLFLELGIPP